MQRHDLAVLICAGMQALQAGKGNGQAIAEALEQQLVRAFHWWQQFDVVVVDEAKGCGYGSCRARA